MVTLSICLYSVPSIIKRDSLAVKRQKLLKLRFASAFNSFRLFFILKLPIKTWGCGSTISSTKWKKLLEILKLALKNDKMEKMDSS